MLVRRCREFRPKREKKPQTLTERFRVKIEVPEAGEALVLELFDLPTAAKMLKNADIIVRQAHQARGVARSAEVQGEAKP